MRWRHGVALGCIGATAIACGTLLGVSEDPAGGGGGDASADGARPGDPRPGDDGGGDGGPGAPRKCLPTAPFAPPGVVLIGVPTVTAARIGASGRVYYSYVGGGGGDVASLVPQSGGGTTAGDDFAIARGANESEETQPAVSTDELTAYLQHRPNTVTPWRIMVTTRGKQSEPFPSPTELAMALVGPADRVKEPYVVGPRLYYTYESDGTGMRKLEVADLVNPTMREDVQIVPKPTSSAEHAVVSADEAELFYASGAQLAHAVAATARRFSAAAAVPIAGYVNVYPTWISPDGCALYVIGEVDGGGDPEQKVLLRLERQP